MKNFTYKIIVFVIILFIISTNLVFSPNNILSWDVFGYYLYLPLKFIYNDLGIQNSSLIQNIIEKYQSTSTFYQVMPNSSGGFVMIYTMGLSFFYAPFFFIGHVIALNSNYVADGFSAPYQYSIFIGGIIYSILFEYIDNWRNVFYVVLGINVLVFMSFWYFFVESPRFFLSKGLENEFKNAILYMAKVSGSTHDFEEDFRCKNILVKLFFNRYLAYFNHESYIKLKDNNTLNNVAKQSISDEGECKIL